MFAAKFWPRVQHRQNILQLIAETKCSTRLIRPAATPDSAAQRLVREPAIDDQIEGVVRRLDLNNAQCVVPQALRFFECCLALCKRRVLGDEFGCLALFAALTQHECEPARSTRFDLQQNLKRVRLELSAARSNGQA